MPAYRVSYATRGSFSARSTSSDNWVRNRNAVRHSPKIALGSACYTIAIIFIVSLVGLIFVSQSAKVTDYDFAIAEADAKITNLEVQRDALIVENAKITAATANEDENEVAATMAVASAADFVKE